MILNSPLLICWVGLSWRFEEQSLKSKGRLHWWYINGVIVVFSSCL